MSETKQRIRQECIDTIEDVTDCLDVATRTQKTATEVFSEAHSEQSHTGHSMQTVIAATICIACRIHSEGVTADEIAREMDVGRNDLFRQLKRVSGLLGIHTYRQPATECIPRVVSKLDVSQETATLATDLAQRIEDNGCMVNCRPASVAGTAVLVASEVTNDRNKPTQAEVALVTGVSGRTIYNHRNTLTESDIEIPIPTTN